MKAPIAEKIEQELTLHGHTRMDPYYWLRERANPKVIDYLNAENAYKDEKIPDLLISAIKVKVHWKVKLKAIIFLRTYL